MSDREIKVTDKRMFTPDGELRDDYRHLEGRGGAAEPAARQPELPEPQAPPAAEGPAPPEASPKLEIPGTPPGLGAPGFVDLVHALADPIPVYLGDVELPDGGSAENLEMARLHIDLLDLLRQRTVGNLTAHEAGYLEELLYQFRMRFVQKRG